MNEMNSITFYRSFFEAIKNLNDDQRLKLYDAIFEYQFEQKNIEFDDAILQSFWILIQPNIDASNVKRLAGAKGGRNKKSKTQASLQKNKKHASSLLGKQNASEEEGEGEEEEEVEEEKEVDVDVENIASPTTATNVFDFYFQNINPVPSSIEVDKIKELQKEYADELICYAIEKAVERKVRNLSYIKAILSSWNNKGITTRKEAEEEKKKNAEAENDERWKRFMEREEKDE